jgi:hypothetical protein
MERRSSGVEHTGGEPNVLAASHVENRSFLTLVFITAVEQEITRLIAGRKLGARDAVLLDLTAKGVRVYHYGPHEKVRYGFPYSTMVRAGNHGVFVEFVSEGGSYHFDGWVDESGRFTLSELQKFEQGKGFQKINSLFNWRVFLAALEVLRGIEAPGKETAGEKSADVRPAEDL